MRRLLEANNYSIDVPSQILNRNESSLEENI